MLWKLWKSALGTRLPLERIMGQRVDLRALAEICEFQWSYFLESVIGHFQVSKPLTFTMRPSAEPFLWKWFFSWEWKIISISKAEHLTLLCYRGPRELWDGLLTSANYWNVMKRHQVGARQPLSKQCRYRDSDCLIPSWQHWIKVCRPLWKPASD